MKIRPLNFEDTFAFSEILDRLDLQDDINDLLDKSMAKGSTQEKQAYIGGQFILKIAKRWHLGKDAILSFVASLTDLKVEEVKQLKFSEVKDVLMQVFTSEDIKAFFSSAQKEQK